jgi:hypothetical protein
MFASTLTATLIAVVGLLAGINILSLVWTLEEGHDYLFLLAIANTLVSIGAVVALVRAAITQRAEELLVDARLTPPSPSAAAGSAPPAPRR